MTQLPSNGSFSVIQNNCGTSVPAGVQCTFIIAFGGSTGQYTANLAITDSAGGNNQIPLTMQVTSGIVPPTISPTSATVSIGKQQQFTTNFVNTQSWTTNAGSVSVSGLFTAQNTAGLGTVTITNTLGGGSAFATVTITSALVANPTSFNFGGSPGWVAGNRPVCPEEHELGPTQHLQHEYFGFDVLYQHDSLYL
jgi:hypothetical protein